MCIRDRGNIADLLYLDFSKILTLFLVFILKTSRQDFCLNIKIESLGSQLNNNSEYFKLEFECSGTRDSALEITSLILSIDYYYTHFGTQLRSFLARRPAGTGITICFGSAKHWPSVIHVICV